MRTPLTVTPQHDREVFMDVLRGFAILGIFIANLGTGFSYYNDSLHHTGPFLVSGIDEKMLFIHHMLIEGKFYSIFSFLFGWGIALQIKRSLITLGQENISFIRRRLLVMLLLGFMHLLIWPGDIVFFYALLGFLLLPLRKYSNKTLLITAVILVLLPIILYGLKMKFPLLNAPAGILFETGEKVDATLSGINSEAAFKKAIHTNSWWDILKMNVAGIFFRYGYLFFVSRITKVLGLMLIGYVVGRSDFYKHFDQHKNLLIKILVAGLVIGIPANYYLAWNMQHYESEYFQLSKNGCYQTIAYALGVLPLALAYIAFFMLSFKTVAGKKILSLLAPVGKMAFSNYLAQSLIGNFVFLEAGLGYMEKVGPVYFTLFGLIVFIGQIIFSTFWLQYFEYGPIEWIWRSLTYGKAQPFLKMASPPNTKA